MTCQIVNKFIIAQIFDPSFVLYRNKSESYYSKFIPIQRTAEA